MSIKLYHNNAKTIITIYKCLGAGVLWINKIKKIYMSIEKREPGENPEEEPMETELEMWARRLNKAREHSTELQKEGQEIQSAKLGTTLLRLMERSGDNKEIVDNLSEFLDGLDHQSFYGQSDKPIGPGRQKELAEFLGEAAKALRWTVGGGTRPADVDINLSKWELGKKK